MLLVTFLIGILTAGILWVFYEHHRRNRGLNKFPGPKKHWFVGNAFDVGNSDETLEKVLNFKHQYGGMVYVRIGPVMASLILSDAESIGWLLSSTKHIEKSRIYSFFHRWIGTGLLNSGGEKWKQRRKIITPTFHFKILEDFIHVFNDMSDVMVKKLRNEIGNDSFDVYPYVTLCALDIICKTAMGTTVNAQEHSESDYVRSVKEMSRIISSRVRSPIKNIDFFYKFTSDYRSELEALKVLHGFTETVIAKRRDELKKKANDDTIESRDDLGTKKKFAFLDLLLQAKYADGRSLSDSDIREEVDTFMFEGHDTTASAITFILYCLANNQDVQSKVVAELNEIFSDNPERNATYQDLQDMKYLEMVIKESLRLYPSVFSISRELQEDIIYDGKLIPKLTTLSIFIYGLNRDPKVFKNPNTFNPDRFLDEQFESPYAYVPFSAGSRNCVGQKFAMLEMKSTVAKVVRNFELLPAIPEHKLVLIAEVVLKSATGVRIRLKERKC
nr:cytochrome P450 monooxygenase CYP4SS1 [Lasioderma serricorne]